MDNNLERIDDKIIIIKNTIFHFHKRKTFNIIIYLSIEIKYYKIKVI